MQARFAEIFGRATTNRNTKYLAKKIADAEAKLNGIAKDAKALAADLSPIFSGCEMEETGKIEAPKQEAARVSNWDDVADWVVVAAKWNAPATLEQQARFDAEIAALEDARDAEIAQRVLAKNAAHPETLVRGAELEAPLRDPRLPAIGSVLTKKIGEVEHFVIVNDRDFTYNLETYKSLSAIAREITGTTWNGFLFFGLTKRGAKAGRKMNARAALIAVIEAIRETIEEAGPSGAPAGPMYAALLTNFPNMTSEQFNRLTGILVDGGAVRREDHVFYSTGKIKKGTPPYQIDAHNTILDVPNASTEVLRQIRDAITTELGKRHRAGLERKTPKEIPLSIAQRAADARRFHKTQGHSAEFSLCEHPVCRIERASR